MERKTWSHLPILLVGVYKTFKHGMFRVGGSCKLRIICAHFLYEEKPVTWGYHVEISNELFTENSTNKM